MSYAARTGAHLYLYTHPENEEAGGAEEAGREDAAEEGEPAARVRAPAVAAVGKPAGTRATEFHETSRGLFSPSELPRAAHSGGCTSDDISRGSRDLLEPFGIAHALAAVIRHLRAALLRAHEAYEGTRDILNANGAAYIQDHSRGSRCKRACICMHARRPRDNVSSREAGGRQVSQPRRGRRAA